MAGMHGTRPNHPAFLGNLKSVDISDAEAFRQLKVLFYQIPHPALVAIHIGIETLEKWGEHQALLAQRVFLERVKTAGSFPPAAVRQAALWATALDAVDDRDVRLPLSNNTQR